MGKQREWPRPSLEPGEVLYEVTGETDEKGKTPFTTWRLTNYLPGHPVQEYDPEGRLLKAQGFRTDLARNIQESKDAGFTVLRCGEGDYDRKVEA